MQEIDILLSEVTSRLVRMLSSNDGVLGYINRAYNLKELRLDYSLDSGSYIPKELEWSDRVVSNQIEKVNSILDNLRVCNNEGNNTFLLVYDSLLTLHKILYKVNTDTIKVLGRYRSESIGCSVNTVKQLIKVFEEVKKNLVDTQSIYKRIEVVEEFTTLDPEVIIRLGLDTDEVENITDSYYDLGTNKYQEQVCVSPIVRQSDDNEEVRNNIVYDILELLKECKTKSGHVPSSSIQLTERGVIITSPSKVVAYARVRNIQQQPEFDFRESLSHSDIYHFNSELYVKEFSGWSDNPTWEYYFDSSIYGTNICSLIDTVIYHTIIGESKMPKKTVKENNNTSRMSLY